MGLVRHFGAKREGRDPVLWISISVTEQAELLRFVLGSECIRLSRVARVGRIANSRIGFLNEVRRSASLFGRISIGFG